MPARSAPPRARTARPPGRHEVYSAGKGRDHLSGSGAIHAELTGDRARRQAPPAAREEGPLLILVDSRGWIEYLVNGPPPRRFARFLEGRVPLLISAIEVYDAYKVIPRDLSEERPG